MSLMSEIEKFTSGWMMKEGGSWKSWKRRYFELEHNTLVYYKDEAKKQRMGEMNLALATNILCVPDYHKKYPYIIRPEYLSSSFVS